MKEVPSIRFLLQLTTEQKRLALLIALLCLTLVIAFWPNSEPTVITPVAPLSTAPPPASLKTGANTPVAVQPIPINRDPFQAPPGLEPAADSQQPPALTPAANKAIVPTPPPKTPAATPSTAVNMRLTGIAFNGDKQVAIIQINGKSQAYQLYDLVGTQRLTQINDASICLNSAGRTQVLTLEQASATGGKSIVKP